jgi:hypothetical protein
METEVITKELQAYNTTDAAIAKIRQDYMKLTIKGLDDKDGFDQVHKARMDVKTRRVAVTKKGKELREDAVAFQKAVLSEEKRIIGMLEPIEDHLSDEENRVAQEQARIKAEAEAREKLRIQARVNRLFSIGCRFDGTEYSYGQARATQAEITTANPEQFEAFVVAIMGVQAQEAAQKAEGDRLRKEEDERLKKVAQEQEAERKRLMAEQQRIQEEQERERQRLAMEAKKIQDEKDRIEKGKREAEEMERRKAEETRRAIELEAAKVEAAEKARIAEQDRIKRESEEKAAKEEKKRLAAERKAARRPDKDKLVAYVDALVAVEYPEFKTDDGSTAFVSIQEILQKATDEMRVIVGAL